MTNGWRIARFDEILTKVDRKFIIDDGQEYETVGVRWYGNGAFVRERLLGANINRKQQWIIKAGDVVYNKLFAWKNAFAIADESVDERIVSDKFPTYQIKTDLLEPKFLDYYFKTPQIGMQAQNLSKGAAAISKLTLNPPQFWDLTIPLPPLTEQRRIVAHIESLAARVNEAQRLREEADNDTDLLFSKATKEIFAKHLDNVTKIGDEFRVTTGGTPSRSNPSYWEGDVRWVSSGEVAFNRIYDTREKITEVGVSESNAKVYPPKTVLIAMIGQGKTRGQCAVLECHAATNQNVAGIHVYETNHLPEYVYWWLRSRYLESRISEIGTAQPALSGERVKQMPIPLPPLDEQRRTVTYLDGLQAKVNALRALQVKTQDELDALLPSLLDKAFKGEL
jgi:type I restriction enzyme S subunit